SGFPVISVGLVIGVPNRSQRLTAVPQRGYVETCSFYVPIDREAAMAQLYLPKLMTRRLRFHQIMTRANWPSVVSFVAVGLSLLSFYRTFLYVHHDLQMRVLDMSAADNGEVILRVAVVNAGNRDAAVLAGQVVLWQDAITEEPMKSFLPK